MQGRRQVVMVLKATGHREDGVIRFKPEYADNRITEIECLELIDGKPVDEFHAFVSTEGWEVKEEAKGKIGEKKLAKINEAEMFADIAQELMSFIDPEDKKDMNDTTVIVHNATSVQRLFDFAMAEVNPQWTTICEYCNFVDVTALARKMHAIPPNQSSLNALCNRYDVKFDNRDRYSAKKDGVLLMNLYLAVAKEQELSLAGKKEQKSPPSPHLQQTIFRGLGSQGAKEVTNAAEEVPSVSFRS